MVAPSVLVMKRVVRNKIPQTNNVDPVSEIIRRYDSSQKAKIKAYADQKSYVKPCDITLGDPVLVKRLLAKSKGMSVYKPNPMMVVKVKGSMITAKNADTTVSRNSSFFKKLTGMIPCEKNDTDLVSKHQKEFPNQSYNPKVNIPDLTPSKHQKESPSQPHDPKVNIQTLPHQCRKAGLKVKIHKDHNLVTRIMVTVLYETSHNLLTNRKLSMNHPHYVDLQEDIFLGKCWTYKSIRTV